MKGNSEADEEEVDYFGLLPDEEEFVEDSIDSPSAEPQPSEVAAPKKVTKPPKPKRRPNRLPDPKPPIPDVSEASEEPVKAFVAKKKAPKSEIPKSEAPAAPKLPPATKKKAKEKPASLPKKKTAVLPKKKTAAPAKKKAARPQPGKAAAPAKRPNKTVPLVLFALTWIAIAACALFAWWLNQNGGKDLEGQVAQLEELNTELASQVTELNAAHELRLWGNEAIAEGHRSALLKLDEYVKNPEIQSLREVANAEIIRIEAYYLTTRRFRGFPPYLPMPFVSELEPVADLAKILLEGDHEWLIRANAARLLSEYKGDAKAADALARAARSDSSLFVAQECIQGFAKLTGYHSRGVFDGKNLHDWWQKNQPPAP